MPVTSFTADAKKRALDSCELGDRSSQPESVAGLYTRERSRLMRYFERRLGDRDLALDLVQEAFARLCAARQRDVVRCLESYLRRVARNLLIDQRAAVGRERGRVRIGVESIEYVVANDNPELSLQAAELAQRINRAISNLTPRSREVFLMHRDQGLRYADIASALEVTVGTVEYHMTRALAHLDRELFEGE